VPQKAPLCDRCHDLIHYNRGNSIYHPSVESLSDTIHESPFKYNHIYHIIDAADFPMSLVPRLHILLDGVNLRTRNRRAKPGKFFKDKKMDMSFIITRSDLLAPTKEQVDNLMPWMRDVLRQALGRVGRMVRLGNVRCVSAKRSWWTKILKEEVWKRGGAGWMVGKVNVGKSQLFESVFPKGRMDWKPSKDQVTVNMFHRDQENSSEAAMENAVAEAEGLALEERSSDEVVMEEDPWEDIEGQDTIPNESMLPPPQQETNYPEMPIVSSLPGTTASPIRVPFGNGKGELIDLPGLARSDLELFVKEEHRQSLIMKSRIVPEQQVIKPGQSLLLGGLIRITPKTDDLIFLAYNFTPLKDHLTSTRKAAEFLDQMREDTIGNIALPETAFRIRHAGTFQLKHDVTKERAGPLTRKDAVKLKVESLPFRVLSIDILVEGCGWVEVVAQVRARHLYRPRPVELEEPEPKNERPSYAASEEGDTFLDDWRVDGPARRAGPNKEEELNWPEIDVYSPEGRFIGSRAPMNSWMLNKPRVLAKHLKVRPRKSMKGEKKKAKLASRAVAAGVGIGDMSA
jgi:genetic interactor of prohibitins 3, mitochondrial